MGLLSHYNRVQCWASLNPSCSSLLCFHGLQADSFCLVLYVDRFIIRGILLAAWVVQKQPFTRKCLGSMYKKNDCLSKDLQEAHNQTHINYSQQSKNKEVSQSSSDPCCCLDICGDQSPFAPPIPPPLDRKETWTLWFLKMNLRIRSFIFSLGAFLINKIFFL